MSYNHTYTALGNALSKCGPSTGHSVVPVAYCAEGPTAHALASLIRLAVHELAYRKGKGEDVGAARGRTGEIRDTLEALGIDTDEIGAKPAGVIAHHG